MVLHRFVCVAASPVVLLLAVSAAVAEEPAGRAEWEPLFNGKDLTGWTPKFTGSELGENYRDTFRVEDGLLKVCYDKWDKFGGEFGHLFWRERLSHYRLRVEYRFVGEQVPGGFGWAVRNSGLMIHGQDPASMRVDQDFPVSIEVQLLGGTGSGPRPTANLCTPCTHVVIDGELVTQHCVESKAKTYDGDQWVTVEVEVHGNKVIRHIVEGKTVLEYSKPQLDPRDPLVAEHFQPGNDVMLSGGSISLQAESHPVEFRKVELLRLDN
jgi:hypothetical protein